MSYFHREGSHYISIGIILSLITFIGFIFIASVWIVLLFFLSFLFLIFSLQFFRYPNRPTPSVQIHELVAPADGKLVANEILSDGRRQLSIFMSPLNVHANWVPIAGKVIRSEYMPGKYLVAWHPKSSTENERHEVDIEIENQSIITVKQIAGAVARRICCYLVKDQEIQTGDELGFIKFGSRVDIVLSADVAVMVAIGEKVQGNKTILARIKQQDIS